MTPVIFQRGHPMLTGMFSTSTYGGHGLQSHMNWVTLADVFRDLYCIDVLRLQGFRQSEEMSRNFDPPRERDRRLEI